MALKRTTSLKRVPFKRKTGNLSTRPKKTVKKAKKKPWKFVKTALAECDSVVSKEVIARDGNRCQFSGCQKTTDLTCSHYIGRKNWNTRFLLSNLLTICTYHHFFNRNVGYEFQKARKEVEGWDGKYTEHMRQLLGEEEFDELIAISQRKPNRKEAIIETQKKYGLRQPSADQELLTLNK